MWVSQEQAEALGFVWSLAHVVSILCYALFSTHEMVNNPGRSRSPIVFWAVILGGPIGLVVWLLERPGWSSPLFIKSGQDTTTWMDTPTTRKAIQPSSMRERTSAYGWLRASRSGGHGPHYRRRVRRHASSSAGRKV